MAPMTSPNDPVFFLHHCFIDKVWADWQTMQKRDNQSALPHYAPEKNGPPGHNLDDRLAPWTHTIRAVLDIEKLGYSYEPSSTETHVFGAVAMLHSRFRSPFMAD